MTNSRSDAYAKAAGSEKYASDYYPPDLLWIGVKRSAHPHAKIISIDDCRAKSCHGIAAVLTSNDIKGKNRVGDPDFDQPVLCDGTVRYVGDPVAVILAEKKEQIFAALELITVEYEPLPIVDDPDLAMNPSSHAVHDGHPGGNILLSGRIIHGDAEAAAEESDIVYSGDFSLPQQEHACLETECGTAQVDLCGLLTIVASTQTPFRDRLEIAQALGLSPDKVRVAAPYLGGGFGGKDGITVQGILGLAALHSNNRPVKIVQTREESFSSSTKRHSAKITVTLGCKRDGTFHLLKNRTVLDTGAYACLGQAVLELALEHAGSAYRIPNSFIEGFCVYTNNPLGGAFRGFGVPQVLAAVEQAVDELAQSLKMDPLELRAKNALRTGDVNACGITMSRPLGMIECLDAMREHPLWKNRALWKSESRQGKRRGVGIAAALHGMGYGPEVPDTAAAKIELTTDGTLIINAGVSDMGQGNIPALADIAHRASGFPKKNIHLLLPDTAYANPSGSSSASRTTFSYGNALIEAMAELQKRMIVAASEKFGCPAAECYMDGAGVCRSSADERFSFSEIAGAMTAGSRNVTVKYTAPVETAQGDASPALRTWGFPHLIFSTAVHLACAEVDELTGTVQVIRYAAVTDAGNVINSGTYEQQVQGGVVQGIGYALFENFKHENGIILTKDLSTYILPTAVDVPDIESIVIEKNEPAGPFGMKGVGEIAIDPVYPAIANAVRDAIGVRISEGPMTGERVLRAMKEGLFQ